MTELSTVGLAGAFLAGIVSFLSPCVLPLVPGYVGYLVGHSASGRPTLPHRPRTRRVLVLSAFFVAGFSTVFIALGASATLLGQLLFEYRHAASILGGSVIILFGLLMTGLLPLRLLQRDFHLQIHISGGTPLSAYVVGLAFGFGWTPCIGPVLGAILTLSAISSSIVAGVLLLVTYSLGLGIPFLVAAAFTDRLVARSREVKRIGRFLYIIAGAIMIVTGIAIISGHLSMFAIWLLQTFPILGKVG